MYALILAGGEASPELAASAGLEPGKPADRALIHLNDEPMIAAVLRALRGLDGSGGRPHIDKLAVVGSPAVHAVVRAIDANAILVAAGDRMVANLAAGVTALRGAGQSQAASGQGDSLLVCSCDIPLVDSEAFVELLRKAHDRSLELAYPIVLRAQSEAAFPGGKRTFARLRDGEFTGGNAFLLPMRIIDDILELTNTAYEARKQPVRLARLLGARLLLKFVTRTLSIRDVEEYAANLLKCRVGAVEMEHAAIAFDVDKVHDLEFARDHCARNAQTSSPRV